jgi:hypothetical protein
MTVHAPGPVQAPPQPSNWKSAAAVGVSEIEVPASKSAAQVVPQ